MNRKLGRFLTSLHSAFLAMALFTVASPVQAGDVLFVSDSLTDAINIPDVLSGGGVERDHDDPVLAGLGVRFRPAVGNGHDVTIIRNDYTKTGGVVFLAEGTNPALKGAQPGVALADYCSVFWSASGPHEPDLFGGGLGADGGLHTDAGVFTSLDTYVAGGGYVFVTGHDAAADPADARVEEFVGGSGAIAVQQIRLPANSAPFGTVSAANNALGTGVLDLGGMTPGSTIPGGVNTIDMVTQDLDYIAGMDTAEVTGVVDEPLAANTFMWTERVPAANGGTAACSDFSKGRIAYVANGIFLFEDLPFNPTVFLSEGEDASWLNDPVYNGALRNFAFNACTEAPLPDDPTNLVGRTKESKVSLTWQGSATADQYNVFRMLDSEAVFQQVGMTAGTVFIETLPAGTTSADYFVVAENSSGLSGPSNTVTVMPSSRRRR